METSKEILAKIWRRSSTYPMVDMDKITIQEAEKAMKLYAIEVLKEIVDYCESNIKDCDDWIKSDRKNAKDYRLMKHGYLGVIGKINGLNGLKNELHKQLNDKP